MRMNQILSEEKARLLAKDFTNFVESKGVKAMLDSCSSWDGMYLTNLFNRSYIGFSGYFDYNGYVFLINTTGDEIIVNSFDESYRVLLHSNYSFMIFEYFQKFFESNIAIAV